MELIKWKDINWKRVEKYVFKWQKLIYKAYSGADICRMRNYQKLHCWY
ncbi:reverse transcriptase N-terminal domain-containing protein [Trichodesmium erythraeum 21-75]|nr:reverse transcriptase N-terminal domain-containing protein [Trichodesmium erythraeum 21-75]